MRSEPIKPYVGARIYVDKASLCEPDVVRGCLKLLDDCGVIVFPRLNLSDEEQVAFTAALGTQSEGTRKFPGATQVSDGLFDLSFNTSSKLQQDYVKTSFFWHMDGLLANAPVPKASMLSARSVAKKGGQTEFANTITAYECLPDDEKADIESLHAMHTAHAGMRWVMDDETMKDFQRVNNTHSVTKEHPIVWVQPSGRKSMKLGTTADYVIGMPIPEGRHLLTRLLEWAVQPEFRYRHQWDVGDVVIWNNHGALHRAIPYDPGSGRAMRRTSFEQARQF